MSFEKHMNCESAKGDAVSEELDLSPQLRSLAGKLSEEADQLSQCFPAYRAEQFSAIASAAAATRGNRRSLRRLTVVSGLCAATALIAVLGWHAVGRFNPRDAKVEGHTLTAVESSQVAQLNGASGIASQNSEAAGGAENVLKGLSGAEQEAVLDLMESHAMQKTSLSI
jgi:hypothetical protein